MSPEFDPKKNAANLARHGVSLAEGDAVLLDSLALTVEDNSSSARIMRKPVDFSRGTRGAVLPTRGKTRITIYLDDAIVEHFKDISERTGKGYQTLINEALAARISDAARPVTAAQVREIIREELADER